MAQISLPESEGPVWRRVWNHNLRWKRVWNHNLRNKISSTVGMYGRHEGPLTSTVDSDRYLSPPLPPGPPFTSRDHETTPNKPPIQAPLQQNVLLFIKMLQPFASAMTPNYRFPRPPTQAVTATFFVSHKCVTHGPPHPLVAKLVWHVIASTLPHPPIADLCTLE